MNCFNLSKSCWQKSTSLTLIVGLLLGISSEVYPFSLSRLIPQKVRSFVAAHPRLVKTTAVGAALLGGYALYRYIHERKRRIAKAKRFMENVAGQFMSERHQAVADVLGAGGVGMPSELVGLINSYEVSPINGRIVGKIEVGSLAKTLLSDLTWGRYQPEEGRWPLAGIIGSFVIPLPGRRFVLFSKGNILIFRTDSGSFITKFANLSGNIYGAIVTPNNQLVCITSDKKVTFFDLNTGEVVRTVTVNFGPGYTLGGEFGVFTEEKGEEKLVLRDSDHCYKIWNLVTGVKEKVLEFVSQRDFYIHRDNSCQICTWGQLLISPGGRFLIAATALNKVHVWDLRKGQIIKKLIYTNHSYHFNNGISNMIYLPQGLLIAITNNGKLVKWNLHLQDQAQSFLPNDSEEMQTEEIDSGHQVRAIEPDDPYKPSDYAYASLVALHDGIFASAAGDDIKIWDPATLHCLKTIDCKEVRHEEWSLHNISLYLLDDKRLLAWVGQSQFFVVE